MKLKRIIIFILVLSLLVIPLNGCNSLRATVNVKPDEMLTVSSRLVDENESYSLEWNEEQKCLLLKNKQTSHIWSTVPYDFFLQNDTNVNMSSPVFINYYNPSDGSLMTAKALADCIEMDNLSVKEQDGKIILEFYFDDAEILIPLEISLEEEGLRATVNAKNIKESGKTRLIDLSVLPYFCSAVNTNEKSSYLFLPVGSGALMYTDEDVQNSSRAFSGEIYGRDAARYILDDNFEEEAIKLPIFGVKAEKEAMLAIVEQGAEAASINGEAGNSRNGHSTVYATFNLRGHDETEVERADFSDAYIYSEEFDSNDVYSIVYYPLTGNDADYNGMARFYKNYLIEKNQLVKSDSEQKNYLLSFLGGSLVRDVFMGVPFKRLQIATTLEDVHSISENLSQNTGVSPALLLKGFGKDGLDVGALAGGFKFSDKSGGKDKYLTLKEYCEQNNMPIFTEYDLVQFSKSANGFNKAFDTAQTAGKKLASLYPLKKNIRSADENFEKISLLKRSMLSEAMDKLLKKNSYVSGFSFTTMSSIAYSDYSTAEYYSKGDTEKQVAELIVKAKNEGHTVNGGLANGYAAGVLDSVTDVPLNNGGYHTLDESIPFYQMIFSGFTAMYSPSLNLSQNYYGDLLSAVECGASPSFVLTQGLDTSLADTLSNEYYGSLYKGSKEGIINTVTATKEYFGLISGKEILAHRIVKEGVTETVFSGDITVTVNHSKEDIIAENDVIPAYSFRFKNGSESKICKVTGGD